MHTQRKGHVRIYQKGGHLQGKTKPADTLVLDFQVSEQREINFCCLNYPFQGILLWQIYNTNVNIKSLI